MYPTNPCFPQFASYDRCEQGAFPKTNHDSKLHKFHQYPYESQEGSNKDFDVEYGTNEITDDHNEFGSITSYNDYDAYDDMSQGPEYSSNHQHNYSHIWESFNETKASSTPYFRYNRNQSQQLKMFEQLDYEEPYSIIFIPNSSSTVPSTPSVLGTTRKSSSEVSNPSRRCQKKSYLRPRPTPYSIKEARSKLLIKPFQNDANHDNISRFDPFPEIHLDDYPEIAENSKVTINPIKRTEGRNRNLCSTTDTIVLCEKSETPKEELKRKRQISYIDQPEILSKPKDDIILKVTTPESFLLERTVVQESAYSSNLLLAKTEKMKKVYSIKRRQNLNTSPYHDINKRKENSSFNGVRNHQKFKKSAVTTFNPLLKIKTSQSELGNAYPPTRNRKRQRTKGPEIRKRLLLKMIGYNKPLIVDPGGRDTVIYILEASKGNYSILCNKTSNI